MSLELSLAHRVTFRSIVTRRTIMSWITTKTSADLYYHTSDDEKQKMLPADLDMDRTTVIANREATSQRAQFHSDVVEWECVSTGYEEESYDAAHLLPHGKGDEVCYYCS